MHELTLEALEALAATLDEEEAQTIEKLQRMIRAYARILWNREPQRFKRQPLRRQDEAGHWDNSFPPSIEYTDHSGPRAIRCCKPEWQEVATDSGFYHSYRVTTTEPGLSVDRFGNLLRCNIEGTGEIGQYAAHPGDKNVDCDLSYETADDPTIEELRFCEAKLRGMAFPSSVKQEEAA